jgi:hypothetical protein
MKDRHVINRLSHFIDGELAAAERQGVGEHILNCEGCRREHDRLRTGALLMGQLARADASQQVWNSVEAGLSAGPGPSRINLTDRAFRSRTALGYAVGLLLVAGLISVAYFTLFGPDSLRRSFPEQVSAPMQTEAPAETTIIPSAEQANNSAASAEPETAAVEPRQPAEPVATWQFETIAGTPTVGTASTRDRLAVGDYLETDSASRARIAVADIGNVEIQPNSLVKLVGTDPKQHRLSLERGKLRAQIFAPPRLFIVDTPSAVAVDLGCEYTLDVDKGGNSFLHVTSGFVALERGGRESIVPAGAMCMTRRGKGLGTPFSADTSKEFRAALERFDFSGGGSRAVDVLLESRGFYDMITLWHLLSRVQRGDRERIYDALAEYVQPPMDVTREGVLSLDKKMLESWRAEVESAWFS